MKLAVWLGGAIFGFGLALAGMTRQEVVLGFLRLDDLGLLLVMGGGIAGTALAFRASGRLERPLLAARFEPARNRLDRSTVLGAVLFGLGWGLSGLCPGSAIASVGTGNWPVLLGWAGMLAGAYAQGRWAGLAPTSPETPPRADAQRSG